MAPKGIARENAKHRSKEQSPSETVLALLNAQMFVTQNGRREKRQTIDVIIDAIAAKALTGDARAFRFLKTHMPLVTPEIMEIHIKGFMKGYAELSREEERREKLGLLPDYGEDDE